MRQRNLGLVLGGLAITATFVGCVIFTGGTNGYSAADPPMCGDAGCDANACGSDPQCSTLQCTSAADCSGDGGQACCLSLSDAGVAQAVCQSTACGALTVQLCSHDSECGDAACTAQKCGPIGASMCGSPPVCGVLSNL